MTSILKNKKKTHAVVLIFYKILNSSNDSSVIFPRIIRIKRTSWASSKVQQQQQSSSFQLRPFASQAGDITHRQNYTYIHTQKRLGGNQTQPTSCGWCDSRQASQSVGGAPRGSTRSSFACVPWTRERHYVSISALIRENAFCEDAYVVLIVIGKRKNFSLVSLLFYRR